MSANFDKAQNEATKLLLRQNISGLEVDVRKFKFDKKIHIDSLQNYCEITKRPLDDFICDESRECAVLKFCDWSIILYNDDETNEQRKHWGIAHEIGHIYLDHEKDGRDEEIEAHFFAAQIVTPEIVLVEIVKRKGRVNPDDLYYNFNASYDSCCKRIHTLQRRYCYNFTENDRHLLERFLPYLEELFSGSTG